MVNTVKQFTVFIASPSDVPTERREVERAVRDLSVLKSEESKVVLTSQSWETDSIPMMRGKDGQQEVNHQLLDKADILVAVFYTRLGNATSRDISGTVEEIRRARSRGIPIHIYFARKRPPASVDAGELKKLQDFKRALLEAGDGLFGSYQSLADLRSRVMQALTADIAEALRQSQDVDEESPIPASPSAPPITLTEPMIDSATSGLNSEARLSGDGSVQIDKDNGTASGAEMPESDAAVDAETEGKNGRKAWIVPITVAIIGLVGTISAALIASLLKTPSPPVDPPPPTITASVPATQIFVQDLVWSVEPSERTSEVVAGALDDKLAHSKSFRQTYCRGATIVARLTYGATALNVSMVSGRVAVLGPKPDQVDVVAEAYARNTLDEDWTPLGKTNVSGSAYQGFRWRVPAGAQWLGLKGIGKDCKYSLAWEDPAVV